MAAARDTKEPKSPHQHKNRKILSFCISAKSASISPAGNENSNNNNSIPTITRHSCPKFPNSGVLHDTNPLPKGKKLKKKHIHIVGIAAPPPTMPPSPRTSLLPNKKWSSLPSKTGEGELDSFGKEKDPGSVRKGSSGGSPLEAVSDWKTLSTEATFVSVNTLSHLMNVCKGESNEMRDVIRTTLDVAKTSEDTRAMLDALENLYKVEELASIVFAKGNEDLSYQLFCNLLNGFGTSYLVNSCVLILAKLFLQDPMRTTTQSLLAISSLQLSRVFIHNFRKSLQVLERNLSINDRSSFVMSITENLSFIDVSEFDMASSTPKSNGGGSHLYPGKSSLHPNDSSSSSSTSSLRPKLSRTLSSAVDLSTRLSTIINSIWQVNSCHNDYRYAELYLKLANYYSHFARGKLRIEMFDKLKTEHESKKRFSEALMCELHVAARLARHTATPEVKRIMLGISRNLKDEFEEVEEWPEEEDNTEELIQKLENCVTFCLKAERYELMLEVYRILVDIQESLSDYAALEHSYSQMSKACSLIQNKRERFLGTYYRVALHKPKKTGDILRPVEIYVYKEPNVTSLTEICAKVETAESAVILSGDVDQLPDDDMVYATITHVAPLPSESPRRKLWSEDFRRHQNIQRFSYDTPFAVKTHDKISIDNKAAVHQQWKRRTTIKTEYTFPAAVNRLRVVDAVEEDLSPIVVAIDDMQRRVNELRSELHSQDIKRIQLRLQGSVSVQVNQGPLAYARAFFERESEYPTHDMNRLKAIFRDFVECCGELLIKNKSLIQPEQVDYHAQLDSDYHRLCTVLSPFIGLPEQAMNRMSRISISSY
ncbi:Dedicator of cytokinesis protein 9 [Orchesella cincta]|uniref:Dedicator of cytokinesis protein 9 n=1 Tax=Orchesella cincta TaxID=48709 RepID=A0A1D2NEJ8_ORCCI|nr:Dedicator of cytokinesis protein 9 [Orchesella cincta]